ncbi:MAG: trypsin-like serine protease [Kofleriaceae bacterium]
MSKIASVFVCLSLVAGCDLASEQDEFDQIQIDAEEAAALPPVVISGGVSADWAHGLPHGAVGYLAREENGVRRHTCTGALITPTLFLTNAHCVKFMEENAPKGTKFFVGFGDQGWKYQVAAKSWAKHPSYRGVTPDPYDVGVVVMASSLASVPVASIRRNGVQTGRLVDVVGYGQVPGGASGSRKLAIMTVTSNSQSFSMAQTTGGTCSGDSGGGVLERVANPNYPNGNTLVALNAAGTGCGLGTTSYGVNLSAPNIASILQRLGATFK